MITPSSVERQVALSMLAIRPLLYRGVVESKPLPSPSAPIADLRLRSTTSRIAPIFHASTNWYGFVDLPAGSHRVHIEDPERRFLPSAVDLDVPDRSALRNALAVGARVLPGPPEVPAPLFTTVYLRPAPGSVSASLDTSIGGVICDALGNGMPFSWVRTSTAQGDFVTYSDERGEYLATLPFLRQFTTTTGAESGEAHLRMELAVTVEAYPLVTPTHSGGDPLEAFPAAFDALDPARDVAGFAAVYNVTARSQKTTTITVGARARLDLQLI